jgi:hypothetical protein
MDVHGLKNCIKNLIMENKICVNLWLINNIGEIKDSFFDEIIQGLSEER